MQQARSNGWLGLSLFFCVTLCCGCQSKPSYGWVYDKRANFAGLKTYQWLSVEEKGTAFRQIGGKPIDQLVQTDVKRVLAAKGCTPVAGGAPADFTVQCTTILEFRRGGDGGAAVSDQRDPALDRTEWYAVESSDRALEPGVPSSYSVGTIYITMKDPKSQNIVWRGVASSVLREKSDPQDRADRLRDAIEKILAKFPPSPGAAG